MHPRKINCNHKYNNEEQYCTFSQNWVPSGTPNLQQTVSWWNIVACISICSYNTFASSPSKLTPKATQILKRNKQKTEMVTIEKEAMHAPVCPHFASTFAVKSPAAWWDHLSNFQRKGQRKAPQKHTTCSQSLTKNAKHEWHKIEFLEFPSLT